MAAFSNEIVEAVWNKASIQQNNDPNVFRKDYAGAWIRKVDYGKQTKYGWEIDHLKPESKGGTDHISNLLPLHWENNRTKSDCYPKWHTSKTSEGVENIDKDSSWFVNTNAHG